MKKWNSFQIGMRVAVIAALLFFVFLGFGLEVNF